MAVLGLTFVAGRITHREISHDDRDLITIEMPFGFGASGQIRIEVRHISVNFPTAESAKHSANLSSVDFSNVGMFIAPATEETVQSEEYLQPGCYLNHPANVVLFRFDQAEIQKMINGDTNSMFVVVDQPPMPEQYALYFANCLKEPLEVSFKIKIEEYNLNAKGRKDYLSVGETELPTVFLFMFVLFSLLAAEWGYLCLKERENVHKIHYLMLVLVIFRALTYLAEAGMYHYLRVTGDPSGWNIAYYVFSFLRGVMFFTVVVLIGTGWSYIKPFIGEKEKKILVIVIPLQILANIAIVILDEASPVRASWFEWRDMFHIVDIICCCAILFPIVWSIKHLREGAETDGKAAVNLEKLTLFRQFYIMVVIYIYFTRIIVYLLQNTVPFQYHWTSNAAEELATLTFYVLVGLKFRPHGNNQYFKLASDASV